MKSGTCFAAICCTVALHAGLALVAAGMLAQPDLLPPKPEPALIQAHLAARPLPVAPLPPAPMPPAPPEKPRTPARPAVQPTPLKPIAKVNAAPSSSLPAIAVPEAKPAPAANPAPPTMVPQATIQPAAPAPAVAAPVKAAPSIPASYAASNRKPDYPLISRRYGEQGTVMLRVYVKADGSAGEVQVKNSSGHELLDESAKSTVQGWRFNPASLDGKPIAEWYQLSIPFTLSISQHN